MLSARDQLNVINAYREVGTYRGAAEMCGITGKTVKRIVEHDAVRTERRSEPPNYELVRALVAGKVDKTVCKITAKRLLPAAVAAGYRGSDRNFRRRSLSANLMNRTREKARTAQNTFSPPARPSRVSAATGPAFVAGGWPSQERTRHTRRA